MPKYLIEIPVLKLSRLASYNPCDEIGGRGDTPADASVIDAGTKEYSQEELQFFLYNHLREKQLDGTFPIGLKLEDIKVEKIANIGPPSKEISPIGTFIQQN